MNAEAEVLLCASDGWRLPGGEVLPGESAEHALNRELLACTGLTLHTPFLLTLLSGPDTYEKLSTGEEIYDFTAVYVVREWTGDTRCASGQFGFFPLDSLPASLRVKDRQALHELRCCWGIC